jgi:hypothetical protein
LAFLGFASFRHVHVCPFPNAMILADVHINKWRKKVT